MTTILRVMSHAEAVALAAHAREDFGRYIEAAEEAVKFRRSQRRTSQLAKQASARAVEAVGDLLPLAEELEREADEIESLRRHMAIAIREECRHSRRAAQAEEEAAWLRGETARLRAEVDQLRAELRDRDGVQ